jgi:hypothetical protein
MFGAAHRDMLQEVYCCIFMCAATPMQLLPADVPIQLAPFGACRNLAGDGRTRVGHLTAYCTGSFKGGFASPSVFFLIAGQLCWLHKHNVD